MKECSKYEWIINEVILVLKVCDSRMYVEVFEVFVNMFYEELIVGIVIVLNGGFVVLAYVIIIGDVIFCIGVCVLIYMFMLSNLMFKCC